jgi:hypothetical protein
VVLGIIIVPLSSGLMNALISNPIAAQREQNSVDAQLLAGYFVSDIQSAVTVQTSGFNACTGVSGEILQVDRVDASGNSHKVHYYYDHSVDPSVLYRVDCQSGAPTSKAVQMIQGLSGTPTVKFDTNTCPCGGTKPEKVTLTITDTGTNTRTAPYTFDLSATRRVTQ